MEVHSEILSANELFYEAFNKQNLDAMKSLWQDDGSCICIHPGWPVLRGFDSIIQSWKDIFDNTDHMEIRLSDVSVVVSADMAWVSCQENLFSIHMAGVQTSHVHTTNLFRQVNGTWKMILHHAASVPSPSSTSEDER
ncbi:nuclear transport factor 2 family protein [Nitrospina gracilis]|uniref:nuclear transport factor 2 family protein n=1 Tax=Nitrospina gracilis TaxID=35801 RepID=UPI001F1A34DB|nr:nuclear transport factor 2 family protein [Nitrospina gracilis]MCF8720021.1 ketosteroid isomerase-like protein [Nitrospina gracilis Nb-211]